MFDREDYYTMVQAFKKKENDLFCPSYERGLEDAPSSEWNNSE